MNDITPLYVKHMALVWSDEKWQQRQMMKGKSPAEVARIRQELLEIEKQYNETQLFYGR